MLKQDSTVHGNKASGRQPFNWQLGHSLEPTTRLCATYCLRIRSLTRWIDSGIYFLYVNEWKKLIPYTRCLFGAWHDCIISYKWTQKCISFATAIHESRYNYAKEITRKEWKPPMLSRFYWFSPAVSVCPSAFMNVHVHRIFKPHRISFYSEWILDQKR